VTPPEETGEGTIAPCNSPVSSGGVTGSSPSRVPLHPQAAFGCGSPNIQLMKGAIP